MTRDHGHGERVLYNYALFIVAPNGNQLSSYRRKLQDCVVRHRANVILEVSHRVCLSKSNDMSTQWIFDITYLQGFHRLQKALGFQ